MVLFVSVALLILFFNYNTFKGIKRCFKEENGRSLLKERRKENGRRQRRCSFSSIITLLRGSNGVLKMGGAHFLPITKKRERVTATPLPVLLKVL